MKMLNREIKPFAEFLLSLELTAKATRMRGRFIKMCQERLDELEQGRIALINKYGKKDINNKVITDENGNVDFENINAFLIEYNSMMAEEFLVDELHERLDMLHSIKDSIIDIGDNIKFSGQKAMEYDRWCEIVEGVE